MPYRRGTNHGIATQLARYCYFKKYSTGVQIFNRHDCRQGYKISVQTFKNISFSEHTSKSTVLNSLLLEARAYFASDSMTSMGSWTSDLPLEDLALLIHWIEECNSEKHKIHVHLIQPAVLEYHWSYLSERSYASSLKNTVASLAITPVVKNTSRENDLCSTLWICWEYCLFIVSIIIMVS